MKRATFALLVLACGYCAIGWPLHTLAVLCFLIGASGLAALSFMCGAESQKTVEKQEAAQPASELLLMTGMCRLLEAHEDEQMRQRVLSWLCQRYVLHPLARRAEVERLSGLLVKGRAS